MIELAKRVRDIPPSITIDLGRRADELRSLGREVVTLVAGQPDFATPQSIRDAAAEAVQAGQTRYSPAPGTMEVRRAVADKLKRENGIDYTPQQIVMANGTKPLLQAAFLTLADPGDEIIVPAPYWVSYPDIIRITGAVPVFVPCGPESGFLLEPEALEQAITPRTRAVLLNTPNNPTGALYDAERLRAIYAVLERHPQVTVVTDEIYEHLIYDGAAFVSPASVSPLAQERTITISGFSKGYVMMGFRMGFAAGPLPAIKGMANMLSHLAGSPNSVSQAAAIEALTGDQSYQAVNREAYRERRDMAISAINQMPGMSVAPTSGSFFAYADISGTIGMRTEAGEVINTDDDFARLAIEEAGVLVVPGSAFGLSPFVRISWAMKTDELRRGLDQLGRFCNSLR